MRAAPSFSAHQTRPDTHRAPSGTSVGAKTLSLKSAVIIAIIFEFTGALVLGRVSQETIAGGIADIGAFTTDPEFCAFTPAPLPAGASF